MVTMTLDATLRVAAGPTLVVGSTLETESYSVAQLQLAEEGAAAGSSKEVPLVPDDAEAVLLCVSVRDGQNRPGTATLAAKNGSDTGDEISITGSLIIASREVLATLVDNGPRSLEFTTVGAEPVTVDVIVAMD